MIDLSYTAAYRLGFVDAGSALVDVEAVVPGWVHSQPPPAPVQAAARVTVLPDVQPSGRVPAVVGAFAVRGENAESFIARG